MAVENDVVAAARRWIGTPYRHQASVRGAGCDCLGLIRGIWAEVMGAATEVPPPYAPDWDAAGGPSLGDALGRHMDETAQPSRGDVLVFRMRDAGGARHLGILAEATFIHAYSRHGVVESAYSAPWRRRVVQVFLFPDRGL